MRVPASGIRGARMSRAAGWLCALALAGCAASVQHPQQAAAADGVYHVTPVRPVAELLPAALAAAPPAESGEFRAADLVELTSLDPTIRLDIRYASTRNLLGTRIYSQARAFLQRPAAEALARVARSLAPEGYGLLVHDAYRPWYVTRLFWDAVPPQLHRFVADPAQGSRHNRGCAVDLTLYELKSGREVGMPSLYDETTERAYPTYAGGTWSARASPCTNSNGGTSITGTGSPIPCRTCASRRSLSS